MDGNSCLTCTTDETVSTFSTNLVQQLLNKEEINEEDLKRLIAYALQIDNATFLSYISKQNTAGNFFIEPAIMKSCIQQLNKMNSIDISSNNTKEQKLEKLNNLMLFSILENHKNTNGK